MTLHEAIDRDDVDGLHSLLEEDPTVLDRVSEGPFPNTPLHIAVANGKTQVAMEVAILKPSFTRQLNPGGYSPMHLALQKKHYHIAKALMMLDPELIRVRGRGGITPLHYIAGIEGRDELELLAEFLCTCKSSIEVLTSRRETAVHVAVKKCNAEAFKVLVGWLKRVNLTEILSWKDQDDHTILEIAESLPRQGEIVKLIRKRTALDALADRVRKICLKVCGEGPRTPKLYLSEYLSRELTVFEKFKSLIHLEDKAARSLILAVATLIATATYQAALTPPGGYWQDNSPETSANSTVVTVNCTGIADEESHRAGELILTGPKLYSFTVLNTVTFLTSIITIWMNAIPLLPRTRMVYFLVSFVACAYTAPLASGFPKSDELTGVLMLGVYLTLLAIVMVGPVISWIKYYAVRCQTDVKGRSVDNFLEL